MTGRQEAQYLSRFELDGVDGAVVVIDVLRAFSTAAYVLGGGATAIHLVAGLDEAIAHIERYGSHHTDSIVTGDADAATRFLAEVDSAIVLHNASTQFADGGEFGFGAEIGIATGRMHARGPVGVEQLCSFKYRVHGDGQTRP